MTDPSATGKAKKFVRVVVFCLATEILYLGVPLLGWGLGHLSGFLSFAPRLGYAVVVALFSLAVGIQAYSSIQGIRGGKGDEDKFIFRQRVVRVGLILFLYLALFFIPYFNRFDIGVFKIPVTMHWLGTALTAMGYLLIFMSGLTLGRQYSADVTIQKDHQLISTGVYRFIRHPRYLGIIALGIGFSLVFRSWIGLVVCLISIGILLFRVRDEEMAMRKEFGLQWEVYCKRSWRLIPYIY